MRSVPLSNSRTSSRKSGPLRQSASAARRGSILVLSAVVLVIIFAMVAFSVDMGYASLTKTQLQIAADGAALAGCLELPHGLGPQPANTLAETQELAAAAAVDVAGRNRNGDLSGTVLSAAGDIQFGQALWNADSKQWVTN